MNNDAVRVDVWERKEAPCPDCHAFRVVISGEVSDDSSSAVFHAFLYHHRDNPEIFIDATLGTWDVDGDSSDHVTFGARTGYLENGQVSCILVTGGAALADNPLLGQRLTRDEALTHPWLERFWVVNDAILEQVPETADFFTHTHV